MKRNLFLVGSLFIFSAIIGYLLSAISFIGRVGVNLFYTQYKFLKIWWKGGFVVFVVWLVFFLVHFLVQKRAKRIRANVVHASLLLIAVLGLYFSYYDFRHTLSHRLLGERFHLGVYLFWIGWIAISIFFMAKPKAIEVQNLKGL